MALVLPPPEAVVASSRGGDDGAIERAGCVGGSVEDVACGDVLFAGDEQAPMDDQCDCGGQGESDRDSPGGQLRARWGMGY